MKEDVVRILNVGEMSDISNRLKKIGAQLGWSGEQTITTYDWSEEFYKKKNILIKLTEADTVSTIEVYTNNFSSSRILHQVHISNDYEQAKDLLDAIGFIPYTKVKILRSIFSYKDLKITLTKFPTIPVFIEINDISTSAHSIAGLLELLKISNYNLTNHSLEQIHIRYDIDYFEEYRI